MDGGLTMKGGSGEERSLSTDFSQDFFFLVSACRVSRNLPALLGSNSWRVVVNVAVGRAGRAEIRPRCLQLYSPAGQCSSAECEQYCYPASESPPGQPCRVSSRCIPRLPSVT